MNKIASLHSKLKATEDEYQDAKSLTESLTCQISELKVSTNEVNESILKKDIELSKIKEQNIKSMSLYWETVELIKKKINDLRVLQDRNKYLSEYLADQTFSFISNNEAMKQRIQKTFDNAVAYNLWSKNIKSNEQRSIHERQTLRKEQASKSQRISSQQANLEAMLKEEKEDLLMLTAVFNHENQNTRHNYLRHNNTSSLQSAVPPINSCTNDEYHYNPIGNDSANDMKGIYGHTEDVIEPHDRSHSDNYDFTRTITTTTVTEEEVIDFGTNEMTDINVYISRSTPWFQKRKRTRAGFRTGSEILSSTSNGASL